MSEESTVVEDTPIVNDAITADDAGFSSDAGDLSVEEVQEEGVEASSEEAAEEVTEVQAETVDELKEEIEEAIEDGATEEEVADMIKEFELKVNGKTIKKKIDLSDEDAIKSELQKALAGQKAMQEKRELEKIYQKEIERLRENPFAVLKELGLDPLELSESELRKHVEEQKKSPEQRAKEQLEAELMEAREELRRQKEEAEQARFQQLQTEESAKLETEIESALDSHDTLPKSPKTVSRIADAMLWAMENGFEDVSVADVLPTVEEEIKAEMRSFMEQLPEQMMEQYIGKKSLDRYRKQRVAAHKPNNVSNVKPTVDSQKVVKEEPKKKVRSKEYFKNLGRG